MQPKEQSLCFSGHRSEKLPQSKEKLESLVGLVLLCIL